MSHRSTMLDRRQFLRGVASGALTLAAPGVFADELMRTPVQAEGPFYPDHLPLDTDNDLIIVNDALTSAAGEITHLSGRVLDTRGEPIRNALIEIWQVDNSGVYIHSKSPGKDRQDSNFQGFGRFLTGSTGEYYFRTIKPVMYGQGAVQRAPHIHYAVKTKGHEPFITQCYIKGDPKNEKDMLFRQVKDADARNSLLVDFAPVPGSRVGELTARFDIVLGFTPEV